MEAGRILTGERSIGGLALHEENRVQNLSGDWVTQFDLAVDSGIHLSLVPYKAHLENAPMDESDPALACDGRLMDLLGHAGISKMTRL